MSTRSTRLVRTAGLAAALALVPGIIAGAQGPGHEDKPQLVGRAVLPVDTFSSESQRVLGFSGIVEGRRPGEWLAMPDNGFGTKANSTGFLIRAYYIEPDFKTVHGGSGEVVVRDFIQFSDPDGWFPHPLVRPDRLLTGGDIDPESLQQGHDGTLWVGDEFGPWILHFDAEGRLLEAPISLPDGLKSPNYPDVPATEITVANSRGIEGMAMSPNGRYLYVVLEGAVIGDAPESRRVYEYDTRTGDFTRLTDYRTEAAGHFIADVQATDSHRLLVIERDGGRGENALFRKVYEVDLKRVAEDGYLPKTEIVDLAAIPDPDLVSLPEIHRGDVGLGDPFKVTCESVEALRVISGSRLLVGCDNNFPNTGRNPGLPDDNEFIVVQVSGTSAAH